MNCPECASVVAEAAVACPNCGCPIDSANETVLKVGFVTFTNVNLKDMAGAVGGSLAGGIVGNRIARNASANLGQNGHGVLTDKRFVFGAGKALKKMTPGAPADFAPARKKGGITFDIPLADVAGISQDKQGFSTLFALDTSGGVYKFALMKKSQYDEWEAAFRHALGR
ncbi:MAG: hypothetical protein FWE69_02540 [Clostridiales bacterium]|nr:hypothetical protein [Clostridiales bacterium]